MAAREEHEGRFERRYRAVKSRDRRFDGRFVVAVTSTGTYCRPSCPVLTPKRENVRFYPTAAAAQGAGFRACKRCVPEAVPGSPEWDARADLVARAMRLIADGVVDREGVGGLARRLGYTGRHLNRLLTAELGAGPSAIARARRAHTARLLVETTGLPVSEVAFAAGFSSITQFNQTFRAVFAATPTEMRRARRARDGENAPAANGIAANGIAANGTVANSSASGEIHLRLPFREPGDPVGTLGFLGERAAAGVEGYAGGVYRRSLRLPRGAAVVALSDGGDHVRCVLRLEDLRDLGAAVGRCRRLMDLDADPAAVSEHLGADPLLGPLVAGKPGRRVPRAVDGAELALRAVLGQRVSVAAARSLAGRLVSLCGPRLPDALAEGEEGGLSRLFPEPGAVAGADLSLLGLPTGRREALQNLAAALASGELSLDPGADRAEAEERLLAVRGVGPWTASYVAMRALGDPDAFLPTDLGVRRALRGLGGPGDARAIADLAERWRPWRAYAVAHLWAHPQAYPGGVEGACWGEREDAEDEEVA